MTFPLRIFAIDREVFVGEAKAVTLPSITGQIQILPQHISLVSLLQEGNLRIDTEQGSREIPISGGVLEVRPEKTVILVNF
ncbi:MAG: hypothetical protein Q8P39_01065 [Candidatus Yanofskybacteria bacterium]|nr:hypothetical protein [Candidatus Yanofskybacteria bacterium]